MKKLLLLILVFSLFINCKNQESDLNQKNTDTETISQDCIPYFDFDEVEYYHIEISTEKILNLSKSKNDSLLYSIINRRTFSNISDSIFIKKLPELGFSNKSISQNDFTKLNQSLCIDSDSSSEVACDPFYRDILIFHKSNKIIGIAKLCFGCSQSLIVNQNEILPHLSTDKKWEDLNKILKNYK